MSRKRIVGPNFFTSIITGDVYQDIIQRFVSQLEKSELRSWSQEDNARPHVSTNTMSFLCEFFNKRLISTNLQPPRSPELSPLDFFLWGYLKNCVYITVHWNLEELEGNISREIEHSHAQLSSKTFHFHSVSWYNTVFLVFIILFDENTQ